MRIDHRSAALPEGIEYRLTQPMEVRADDGGTFEGYAMLWDTIDSYGTRFASGAFGAGGLDMGTYALLWMHDPMTVLGTFTAKEDGTGLYIVGRFDDTPDGQAGRARAKSKSAAELSVGFSRLAIAPEDPDLITAARLVETSQITSRMAAVPGAAMVGVRAAAATLDQEAAVEVEAKRMVARLQLINATHHRP